MIDATMIDAATIALPRPRHRALGLAVLLLHALLVLGLLRLTAPGRPPASAALPSALLWLLPASPTAPRDATPPARERERRKAPAPPAADATTAAAAAAAAPPRAPAEPQAITLLPAAPPASAPPLNLVLPRRTVAGGGAAAAARDDPRLLAAPGREARLAAALGSDPRLRVTPMADGYVYRRGGECLRVRPARESQINPFNQSGSPIPHQASGC